MHCVLTVTQRPGGIRQGPLGARPTLTRASTCTTLSIASPIGWASPRPRHWDSTAQGPSDTAPRALSATPPPHPLLHHSPYCRHLPRRHRIPPSSAPTSPPTSSNRSRDRSGIAVFAPRARRRFSASTSTRHRRCAEGGRPMEGFTALRLPPWLSPGGHPAFSPLATAAWIVSLASPTRRRPGSPPMDWTCSVRPPGCWTTQVPERRGSAHRESGPDRSVRADALRGRGVARATPARCRRRLGRSHSVVPPARPARLFGARRCPSRQSSFSAALFLDGYLDDTGPDPAPALLAGSTLDRVDEVRASVDSILVGAGTDPGRQSAAVGELAERRAGRVARRGGRSIRSRRAGQRHRRAGIPAARVLGTREARRCL